MQTISIIIVNWNTRETTLNCLDSIYRMNQGSPPVEIILVDNASEDNSVAAIRARFPEVCIIQNSENAGYARANNQGIRQAQGQILLLLNSDTLLKDEATLNKIIEFFEQHPQVGILGAKLVYSNGRLQAAGRNFISLTELVKTQLLFSSAPVFNRLKARKRLSQPYYECDYVDGACLAIRRAVVEEIGLLNEEFFMYGEDMEWCARARDAGWKVAVLPSLEVVHLHAESAKKNYRKILVLNTRNNCQIMRRYYGKPQAVVAFYIFLIGMGLRIFVSLFRSRQQVGEYFDGLITCFRKRKEILSD